MGMETTPLHKHPETRELIVNSDINTGNYNIIANDIMANNITVNNLTSNSITNTGDISTDTLQAAGGITGTLYGEQVHVVECIPSSTKYVVLDSYAVQDVNSSVILPFIPSTYYTGKLKVWAASAGTLGDLFIYNVDGSMTIHHITTTDVIDYDLPNGTIGVVAEAQVSGNLCVGWTNTYLPLPPQ